MATIFARRFRLIGQPAWRPSLVISMVLIWLTLVPVGPVRMRVAGPVKETDAVVINEARARVKCCDAGSRKRVRHDDSPGRLFVEGDQGQGSHRPSFAAASLRRPARSG